jgi:hypothetical protein
MAHEEHSGGKIMPFPLALRQHSGKASHNERINRLHESLSLGVCEFGQRKQELEPVQTNRVTF